MALGIFYNHLFIGLVEIHNGLHLRLSTASSAKTNTISGQLRILGIRETAYTLDQMPPSASLKAYL